MYGYPGAISQACTAYSSPRPNKPSGGFKIAVMSCSHLHTPLYAAPRNCNDNLYTVPESLGTTSS